MDQVEPIGRRTLGVGIGGRGAPTVGRFEHCARPGFIEELPWWVGVGRGLTPGRARARCAQRLFPGRGCGWAPGGLTVLVHRFAGRSRRGLGCVKRRQLVKPPSSQPRV